MNPPLLVRWNNTRRLAEEVFDLLKRTNASKDDVTAAMKAMAERAEKIEERGIKLAFFILILDVFLFAQIAGVAALTDPAKDILGAVADVGEALLFLSAIAFYIYSLLRAGLLALAASSEGAAKYLTDIKQVPTVELQFMHGRLLQLLLQSPVLKPRARRRFTFLQILSLLLNFLAPLVAIAFHLYIQTQYLFYKWETTLLPAPIAHLLLIAAMIANLTAMLVVLHVRMVPYTFEIPAQPAPPLANQDGSTAKQ